MRRRCPKGTGKVLVGCCAHCGLVALAAPGVAECVTGLVDE